MRERASRGRRGQDQGFGDMEGEFYREGPSGNRGAPSSGQPWTPRPAGRPSNVATKFSVQGEVKWFNPDKGFGFAAMSDGSDAFVHVEAVNRAGVETLNAGDRIVADVGPSDRGEKVVTLHSVEPGAPSASTSRPRASAPSGHSPAAVLGSVSGVVKFFDTTRGFGFLAPDKAGPDVFVHASALQRSGIQPDSVAPGTRLSGDVVMGRNGKAELGSAITVG